MPVPFLHGKAKKYCLKSIKYKLSFCLCHVRKLVPFLRGKGRRINWFKPIKYTMYICMIEVLQHFVFFKSNMQGTIAEQNKAVEYLCIASVFSMTSAPLIKEDMVEGKGDPDWNLNTRNCLRVSCPWNIDFLCLTVNRNNLASLYEPWEVFAPLAFLKLLVVTCVI